MWTFRCLLCGYDAMVVGGRGGVMRGVIKTIACQTCEKLYDVLVLNWRGPVLEPLEPRCPRLEEHAVEPWAYPGPCPRCGGGMMERGSPGAEVD